MQCVVGYRVRSRSLAQLFKPFVLFGLSVCVCACVFALVSQFKVIWSISTLRSTQTHSHTDNIFQPFPKSKCEMMNFHLKAAIVFRTRTKECGTTGWKMKKKKRIANQFDRHTTTQCNAQPYTKFKVNRTWVTSNQSKYYIQLTSIYFTSI